MTVYARPNLPLTLEAAVSVLGGNAARVAIIGSVVAHPEETPAQIAARVNLTVATVRGHLKQLLDEGLFAANPHPDLPFEERRGQWVRYSVNDAALAKAYRDFGTALGIEDA